jgi:hypothetical protein
MDAAASGYVSCRISKALIHRFNEHELVLCDLTCTTQPRRDDLRLINFGGWLFASTLGVISASTVNASIIKNHREIPRIAEEIGWKGVWIVFCDPLCLKS